MKRYIPWVLLGVSVLFNGGFAWGYFHTRGQEQKAGTDEGRTEMVVKQLSLTEAQKLALADVRKKAGPQLRQLVRERQALRRQIREELLKSQPDRPHLRQLVREQYLAQAEIRTAAAEAMADFLKTLTPPQKETWATLVNHNSEQPL